MRARHAAAALARARLRHIRCNAQVLVDDALWKGLAVRLGRGDELAW